MEYGTKHYHHEIWQQRDDDGNIRWHVYSLNTGTETCHEDAATSIRIIESGIQVAKSFDLSERQEADKDRLEVQNG